jgi:hypothetical protein
MYLVYIIDQIHQSINEPKKQTFLIIRTTRNITVYIASNFLNKKKFQDGVLDKGGTRKNIDFDL